MSEMKACPLERVVRLAIDIYNTGRPANIPAHEHVAAMIRAQVAHEGIAVIRQPTRSNTKIVELLREAVSIARSYIAEDGSRPMSATAKERRHSAVLATLDAALAHIEEEAGEPH